MSVAMIESAVLLLETPNRSMPRACDVEVLTSQDSALLLISPVALVQREVWLKRISPRFDRKFLKCRVNNPDSSGPVYSLTIIGFGTWSLLTDRICANLIEQRPQVRPSTMQTVASPVLMAEQSLMPLLSAIGLVVVYASNLPW